ncbi:LOW QUALITY PROTEIN: cilia- and flagella-associated protein 141 [Malaclemys terrapin pileata]|uniref:LOW QUALITY PROTEIN: cilia- and flagella-associated protein 141 n=1 Tax=Malaclemys terrapin pileata TaxID=2991368 RepID=UPI0023A872FC|nr:LOW QUALITY PROTEIN: cilia- and flagella-associated protein 141 [Malaclemys terrapin pileata]
MVTREPNGNGTAAAPSPSARPVTMAPGREKLGKSSNAPSLQQLLREEELLKKEDDYQNLVKSWQWGRVLCLQREKQEEKRLVKGCQNLRAGVAEELRFANKALLMVRRAALRYLLHCEHLQHQRELNHGGKSFYVERL